MQTTPGQKIFRAPLRRSGLKSSRLNLEGELTVNAGERLTICRFLSWSVAPDDANRGQSRAIHRRHSQHPIPTWTCRLCVGVRGWE